MNPNITSLLGTVLGGYRLERPIGIGGTGAVFMAQAVVPGGVAPGSPDVAVAVKVLVLPWQANVAERDAFRARFRREAQVLRQLHHPHIVPILNFGEEGELSYIIMPLMPGGSLNGRLVREKTLPLLDVARYLDQVAAALDYAHASGIVHRDLKPGNILLDARGDAHLADFGIVRFTTVKMTTLTFTGHVVGTPNYMAPELIRGQEAGPPADLYGLGMVAYELVTGHTAFDGATVAETLLLQVHDRPPPPTVQRPDLPRSVEPVLLRALAKEPHDRYPTATAFATAFRQALIGGWDVPTQPHPLRNGAAIPSPLAATLDADPTSLPPLASLAPPHPPFVRICLSLGMAVMMVASALFFVTRHAVANPMRLDLTGTPTALVLATATSTPQATDIPSTPIPTPTSVPPTPVPPAPTATPLPPPAYGDQLLSNPSFEGYQGWCLWNNNTNQLAICDGSGLGFYEEAYVVPYDGTLYGVHYSATTAYDVTTFQGLTTAVDAYYSVAIMAWSTCEATDLLFLKDDTTGATSDIVNASCLTGGWTHIAAGPFFVPRGHYLVIQIRSRSGPGAYFRFDHAFLCAMPTAVVCA